MSPEDLNMLIEELTQRGVLRQNAQNSDLAKLLGISRQTVIRHRETGTQSRVFDYACAALAAGLEPYGQPVA